MHFLQTLVRNHVPANLVFLLVLVTGTLSYLSMPRAKDPDINFNWINIITLLPGASALDVEKRITDPIEDVISRSVKDIRFVSSTSREGISIILVRFQQLNEKEFDKRVVDLRREVQNVYVDLLPDEAQDPLIVEITSSSAFPTATIVLTGEALDEDMRRYATYIEKEIERLPGVDQALMNGTEEPELHIEFYPERLEGLGITPDSIADTVRSYYRDISVGDLEDRQGKWVIRLQGTNQPLSALENFPVTGVKGVVTLGDVADIYRTTKEPEILVRFQGKSAIHYTVNKQDGANTLELLDRINAFIASRNAETASQGLRLVLVDDQTVSTREALSLMQNNALIGLLLVVMVAWLFLGGRIALLTGIGIPFTLAGAFILLSNMGMTLNNNVLLGVVIALGMLVDDAVVVVEAIYYRLQRGMDAVSASVQALQEVAAPVMTSVLTTIAAFLPLMLLPGILGEFMKIIPLTVAAALLISLIEAFWILPVHVGSLKSDISRHQTRSQKKRVQLTRRVRLFYSRLLVLALRFPSRALAMAACVFLLAITLLAGGVIKWNFFASDAFRIFYVNIEMPPGASLENTINVVTAVEKKVLTGVNPDELRDTVSLAGQMLTKTEPLFGDNIGQVLVSLEPQQNDGRHVTEIIDAVDKILAMHRWPGGAKVTILLLEDGPPLGRAISVKVRGDDFDVLQQAVGDLMEYMNRQQGLFRQVSQDYRQGNRELQLVLDGDAIQRAGLPPERVVRTLQSYVDGERVLQYQDKGEEVTVRVIARHDKTGNIDRLLQQSVALPDGNTLALGELVNVTYGFGQQNIRHYNFRRTINIESDIDDKQIDTVAANEMLVKYWDTIADRYPRVTLEFSGELDDIQESLDAITLLFVMGLGLIYLILGTQFGSYWQPLLVLVAVPLAFTGVVLGLAFTGNPLSLYTLYGIVALSGISVNAAIVLISAANDRLKQGMSVLHATVYAARRRVIPILMTSLTTIAGLFSLAAGFAGESMIWGPVATTIVSGLISSTILTLFVVPLVFRLAMKKSDH